MSAQVLNTGIGYDDALKGLKYHLEPNEEMCRELADLFGMIRLEALRINIETLIRPRPAGAAWVLIRIELSASVTQECGVSLAPFTHDIKSHLEIDVRREGPKKNIKGPESELVAEDLDEPDIAEDGRIDLKLYVIEALGVAYDPYARAPGIVFVEPEVQKEISPFAALAALKKP